MKQSLASAVGFALRHSTRNTSQPLSNGHAQQLFAAALGFKSFAAYQACSNFSGAEINSASAVLDPGILDARAEELGVLLRGSRLRELITDALARSCPSMPIHWSFEAYLHALSREVRQDLDQLPAPPPADPAVDEPFAKHVFRDELKSLSDIEKLPRVSTFRIQRQTSGGHDAVSLLLMLTRVAGGLVDTRLLTTGPLPPPWNTAPEEDHDDRPTVPYAIALARMLGITLDEAIDLAHVDPEVIHSADGVPYYTYFDFSDHASPPLAAKLRHRNMLTHRESPSFMDCIGGPMPPETRVYLHGDEQGGRPEKFYCGLCKKCYPAPHFEAEHGNDNLETYLQSLRNWRRRPVAEKYERWRPDYAQNLFELSAMRAEYATPATPGEFFKWLQRQKDRNDLIGDLASDARRDVDYPVAAETLDEVLNYLARQTWDPDVLDAVVEAWAEYERKRYNG